MGCLITWSWHAVQPGHEENDQTGWNVMHNGPDAELCARICTEGSAEQKEWFDRLDNVAGFIKQLQDAGVPLIWRPFHECNYGFFWWGAHEHTPKLFRKMWHRFVHHHGLHNIIWNYNVNYEFKTTAYPNATEAFYPGDEYTDMVSMDIYLDYKHRFTKSAFDKMYRIGKGRPVAIGENGLLPDPGKLQSEGQNWVYWMTWNGFQGKTGNYSSIYTHRFVLGQGEVEVPEWDESWDPVPATHTSVPLHASPRPAGTKNFHLYIPGTGYGNSAVKRTTAFSLSGQQHVPMQSNSQVIVVH
jgi:mannan endo-1,4-beta-mannosidase